MNKTIHIIGAGGPAGVGLTRCLKEHYDVIGYDSSQWGKLMMECDEASPVGEPFDLCISLSDKQVLSNSWDSKRNFLPPTSQIELCQDKAQCAQVLGDLAPKTYWIRNTHGAGGAGAQMASELLPGRNYSQEFVFYNGKLLAWFQKQRLSYSVKEKTSGLDNRGSSAVSICEDRDDIFDTSLDAIGRAAVETKTLLHGFYGVDMVEDENGVPKVTEINAGRLLTASYSYYYLTGYNLPLVGVKAFLGEEPPVMADYPVGYGLIRQVGQEPRLFPPEITKDWI